MELGAFPSVLIRSQGPQTLASVHLLQPAAVPAWASMPLVTVDQLPVPQLPDLLRHWTSQTLLSWLPRQPRPRDSILWPLTGSLVGDIGRQYHQTTYRHSSHDAHRADITHTHPSQHCRHSTDTSLPTDTTYPHPRQTLHTYRHKARGTTNTPTLSRHTHPANTAPHQPMLIADKSHVYPLLIEYAYTLTLSQAPTHSYTADTTPTHPQHTLYAHPPAHTCPHIHWSWWPYTWYIRKLRSSHQSALKSMRWRELRLCNLPDEM